MKRIFAFALTFVFCSFGATFAEFSNETNIDELFPFTPEEYEPLGYSYLDFVIAYSELCNDIMGVTISWSEQSIEVENGFSYYTASGDGLLDINVLVDSDNNVLAVRTADISELSTAAINAGGQKFGNTLPYISLTDDFIITDSINIDTLTKIYNDVTVSLTDFFSSIEESDYAFLSLYTGMTYEFPVNGRSCTFFYQSDYVTSIVTGGIISK